MKIVDKRNNDDKLFDELNVGETFIFDNRLYVKSENSDGYNSFCFTNSKIMCFGRRLYVTPVFCDVIIRG